MPALVDKISSPGQFYLWAGETGFTPDCPPQGSPANPPQSWAKQPVPSGWKIPSAADFGELLKVSAPNPGTDADLGNTKGFLATAEEGPDGVRGIWLGPTCTTAVNGKNPDHTENIFLPLNGYFYGSNWFSSTDVYVSDTYYVNSGGTPQAGFLFKTINFPGFYMNNSLSTGNGGLLRPVKSN